MTAYQVVRSATFDKWLSSLKDKRGAARVLARVRRLAEGNPGDVRPVGGGLSELRINYGPGYRVYFVRRASTVVVLLCGGDKSTQRRDIERAHQIAQEWDDDEQER